MHRRSTIRRRGGNPRRSTSLGLLVASLLLVASATDAQVVANLTPFADNTMYSESGTLSNGAGDHFFAGRTNQNPAAVRRALLRFDIGAAVPAGSAITAVRLTLYQSRTKQGTDIVSLHRALAAWGEGTSHAPGEEGGGAPATLNDATWTYRFFNPASPSSSPAWATPGGTFVATPSASLAVANTNGFYTWSSTPALVVDVQSWLDSPAANYGWEVIGPEGANRTACRFDSRQNSTVNRRPSLEITYTPPATTGACCLISGSCQILTSTQCAAAGGTYQGNGTTCSPNPCPQPSGACCLVGGTCMVMTAAQCQALNGYFSGSGSTCSPNPCLQLTGACCFPTSTCQVLTLAQCESQGGTFQGYGSACTTGLCPFNLEKYVDELPRPGVAQPASGTVGGAAHYNITINEFNQQLHRDLPPTRVWGFNGGYPGPTIEAGRDLPVTVTWINDLRDAGGQLRTAHYLPVDTCLHGPNTHGAAPRTVVHLHGGFVTQESDGYPEATFLPGQQSTVYTYPNTQLPATIWYHDHALGITRLNVYMGMAGFYLIRDEFEDQLDLPSGEYEIALAIQDRSFNPDGTLKYTAQWMEHFFGDTMLVNGKVWPYAQVKRGKYRFRIVNGCTSRTLTLSLSNGAPVTVIGVDAGMLPAPVPMTQLTLSPGERSDLIIDFQPYAAGTEIRLVNSAPAPYPGTPGVGVLPDVMKFVVESAGGSTGPIPSTLRPVTPLQESTAVATRTFTLKKGTDPCTGSIWLIDDMHWDHVTEFPRLNTTEIWSFINESGTVHPMHLHLVPFQVLDRQPFEIVGGVVTPTGPRVPPPAHEAGWKDTAKANPQEITRIIVRFDGYSGYYPYHCHIIEHEDHEMMRQFRTVCYHDCNEDQLYTAADFGCFQTTFAAGSPYADCTGDGVLTVADFGCFQTKFVAGCP